MKDLDLLFAAHRKVALQFSGGRDSLAMLLYLEPYWDKLTVYYCDSGESYSETQRLISVVEMLVPHFVRVKGRTAEVREANGWASDVIPARAGFLYGKDSYRKEFPIMSREVCCFKSLMAPLHAAMLADKITLVLRGQRSLDHPKNPLPSGSVVDGVTLVFPIESWTTAQVEEYITSKGWSVPLYYAEGMTSAPDCRYCTAWLEHGALRYQDKYDPHAAGVVRGVLSRIINIVEPAFIRMVAEARETV